MNALALIRAATEPTRVERPLHVVFTDTLEALHKQPVVFRTKHCVFRVHTRRDYDPGLGHLNDFRIIVNHNTDLPVEYGVEFHDSTITRTGVDEIQIFNKTRKSFAPIRIPEARNPNDLLARCLRAILNYYGDTGPDRVSRATHAATEPTRSSPVGDDFVKLVQTFDKPAPAPVKFKGVDFVVTSHNSQFRRPEDRTITVAVKSGTVDSMDYYVCLQGYHDPALDECINVRHGRRSGPGPIVRRICTSEGPADLLKQILSYVHDNEQRHAEAGVHAAAEPGSEVTGTERGYRDACQLIMKQIDARGESASWLKRVAVGSHKVDIAVVESTDTIFNPKNLIPLVVDVVYSDVTSTNTWNQLRRTFTYNTKTNTVNMGNVVVPGSPDPARMLKSMLSTYVKHVNLFAHGAAEPTEHTIGADFIVLARKFERPKPTAVKFKDADFVVTAHSKFGAIDRLPQHRTIIVAAQPGTPDSADYCVNLQGYRDEAIRECVAVHSNTRNTSVLVKRFYTSSGPTNLLQQIMAYVHSEEQRHAAL